MSEAKNPEYDTAIFDRLVSREDFVDRVVCGYNAGTGPNELPADVWMARSIVPAGTGRLRDFSYIAPDIPIFHKDNCTGCMDCVTECPDTAILAKVLAPEDLEQRLASMTDEQERQDVADSFAETTKYYKQRKKKDLKPGLFGIFIDPTKCKGCAECVHVCGEKAALSMVTKTDENMPRFRKTWDFYQELPAIEEEFINEKTLGDMMLADRSLLYVGGAGSCMGCGEATALRMMLAATGFVHGPNSAGIVAMTGCNTVYGSTYPYNPFQVPWINSLFENGPSVAIGLRLAWDARGWEDRKIWVVGGDGALLDIGFQPLSRLMASDQDVNVIVLDTQVYSNTGGQTSTATFMGQSAKMSRHGKAIAGKQERRKEIGQIAMMHPDVYVAQTTPSHVNHFYKAIMRANEYKGPSLVNVYTACQPEHGIPDYESSLRAKMAVDCRAFPLFTYDPEAGDTIRERLDLKGNPAKDKDWYENAKGEVYDFVAFARGEGRFAKHFDKQGNPSDTLLASQADRLKNWHVLQELAGLR